MSVAASELMKTPSSSQPSLPNSTSVQPVHYVLLLLMGALWGLALSVAKIGVQAGGHPVGMGLWQVTTSAILLLCILFMQSKRPVVRADVARFGLICGSCGVAFPSIALFWCARYLPAGVVAIAFASMPLFTYLIAVMLRIERSQRRRLLGVVVGLVAMALLVLPESALPEPGLAPWVLLALIASISMSIENSYAGGFRPPRGGFSRTQLRSAGDRGIVVASHRLDFGNGSALVRDLGHGAICRYGKRCT